jgi:DNA-binding NtrC family response regulator
VEFGGLTCGDATLLEARISPVIDARQRRPAVLVVEDEVLLRLALADYLQECGFKVFGAASVAEAIEILQSETEVDVVFTDIELKGEQTGFDLAQWVRKHRSGLLLVLTSGDAKKATAAKELCEKEPFLAKPYDLDKVVKQLRALIESRQKATPEDAGR